MRQDNSVRTNLITRISGKIRVPIRGGRVCRLPFTVCRFCRVFFAVFAVLPFAVFLAKKPAKTAKISTR